MENAHLRMGKLTFVRQTKDSITRVTLHLERLVAEAPANVVEAAYSIWFRFRWRSGYRRDRAAAMPMASFSNSGPRNRIHGRH